MVKSGGGGGNMTAKAISNRIKAKGLQKLKWYCQMCQKQCRDENGMKCHMLSESHLRQMRLFAENPATIVSEFSTTFKKGFLEQLNRFHGTKKILANRVYNEYIQDKHHIHMNATEWSTLSEFVKSLGRDGDCIVDETEEGWTVQYIDRSSRYAHSLYGTNGTDANTRSDEVDEDDIQWRGLMKEAKDAEAALSIVNGSNSNNSNNDVDFDVGVDAQLIASGQTGIAVKVGGGINNNSGNGGSNLGLGLGLNRSRGKEVGMGIVSLGKGTATAFKIAKMGKNQHSTPMNTSSSSSSSSTSSSSSSSSQGRSSQIELLMQEEKKKQQQQQQQQQIELLMQEEKKQQQLQQQQQQQLLIPQESDVIDTQGHEKKSESKSNQGLKSQSGWLMPGIRVRIVDKRIKVKVPEMDDLVSKISLYKCKGKVVGTSNRDMNALLEVFPTDTRIKATIQIQLEQDSVETVIPREGQIALLLKYPWRGANAVVTAVHREKYCVDALVTTQTGQATKISGILYEDISLKA